MKRQVLQNKQAGVLRMAFRARKAFGTFEKRAHGPPFNMELRSYNDAATKTSH